VAQQVLEYLGVRHDVEVRTPHVSDKTKAPVMEDASDNSSDIEALYAAANDLPSDDPLRGGGARNSLSVSGRTMTASPTTASSNQLAASTVNPGGVQTVSATAQTMPFAAPSGNSQPLKMAVMVIDPRTLRVPSLIGLPVRKVIEQAAAVGLEVHVTGSGTAREQAPAAGTMVASGTQIVVRCGR
jgi:cell division protein FtsI (penicillin-binding protein 3)